MIMNRFEENAISICDKLRRQNHK